MAILGLLLLAAAVAAGLEFGLSNMGDVGFEVFGTSFTAPLAVLFVLGAIAMAVATLGLFLVTGSFQRRRAHRYEAKHRVEREQTNTKLTEYDETTTDLVAENDRLRAELAAERRAAATMGGVTVPPGTGNVPYGDKVTDAVRGATIDLRDPYPVSPVDEVRPATIDNTRFDDDARAGEQKAGVLGRFRGDNR